jgi:hypothetical protein
MATRKRKAAPASESKQAAEKKAKKGESKAAFATTPPETEHLVKLGKFSEADLQDVPSPTVRLIGDPALRAENAVVSEMQYDSNEFLKERRQLHRALHDFRAKHGFGRSIAAPQIGINKRLLALNLGKGPCTLVNPVITWRSKEKFTLFDDCEQLRRISRLACSLPCRSCPVVLLRLSFLQACHFPGSSCA